MKKREKIGRKYVRTDVCSKAYQELTLPVVFFPTVDYKRPRNQSYDAQLQVRLEGDQIIVGRRAGLLR